MSNAAIKEATEDTTEETTAVSYGITWGVRESFVGYIRSLADGSIDVSDGALVHDGNMHFPLAGLDAGADPDELWISTAGAVRFEGHYGMLTVPLLNLRLRLQPESAVLFSEQADGTVIDIAEVDLGEPSSSEAGVVWEAAPVALTAAGSSFFGDNYPVGSPMDPVRLHLPPLG